MFFDIDGTILTEDTHIIPESTTAAIKKAREKGHLAFINTGRTFFNVEKEIRDIGFDGFVCGCGTYININNQVVEATTIEESNCRKIIDLLRKHKMDAVLEGLEDVFFDSNETESDDMKWLREHFTNRGYGLEKNWDAEGLIFDKIFAKANSKADMEAFKAELGNGFQEHYQLPLENAFVFGDSSNDLPMFEYVPNSIAMGNSDACVYDIASFVTRDIHEDGIAYAMKKLQII